MNDLKITPTRTVRGTWWGIFAKGRNWNWLVHVLTLIAFSDHTQLSNQGSWKATYRGRMKLQINMGGSPKMVVFTPQIIHLFIGFSMKQTIHFGVHLFLETPIYRNLLMGWPGKQVQCLGWCHIMTSTPVNYREKYGSACGFVRNILLIV